MRPLSLRLRGLTRFRGDVDLDLTQLPPGVVAVVGGNGAGKSTLLEALAPLPLYLEMPSYPGKLADNVSRGVRDAVVELTQEYAGSTWRHVIQIDGEAGGGRGKTEAYLYRDGAPVTEHGRLADYEAAVGAAFPSRSVLYASSFSCQRGTGNFFELSKAERRDLFASLLGLEALQAQAERARRHRSRVEARIADVDARLAQLRETQVDVGALEAEAEADGKEHSALYVRLVVAVAQADSAATAESVARAELALAQQARDDHAVDLDRTARAAAAAERSVADLEQAVAGAEASLQAALVAPLGEGVLSDAQDRLAEARDQVSALLARGAAARAEMERAEQALVSARTEAELVAIASRDLAAAQAAVSAAMAASARLEDVAARLARVPGLVGVVEDLAAGGTRRSDCLIQARNMTTLALHRAIDAQMAHAARLRERQADTETAALLEAVPCGGGVVGAVDCSGCPLIGQATAARGRIAANPVDEDAGIRTAAVVADARSHDATVQEIDGLVRALAPVADRRDAETARVEDAQARLARVQVPDPRPLEEAVRAARADRDAIAEPYRTAQATVTRLEAHLQALEVAERDRSKREARARGELAAAGPALTEARNRLQEAREARAAVLTRPDPGARVSTGTQALTQAAWVLSDARRQVSDLEAASAALLARASHRGGLLEAARTSAASAVGLEATRGHLAEELRGWVLLERGLGRDGVQALEVDAAGPEVSDLVNELLIDVFGSGRFQARLTTVQEAGRGRTQKEVFDLEVLDGEAGEARSADRFSAGERTLISEALKLAIAIYSARRAPHPIETLYRDECDGPLEEGLAERYPAMLRRALALGGYRNVLVISHRESVWAQADALLRVAGGQVTVEIP